MTTKPRSSVFLRSDVGAAEEDVVARFAAFDEESQAHGLDLLATRLRERAVGLRTAQRAREKPDHDRDDLALSWLLDLVRDEFPREVGLTDIRRWPLHTYREVETWAAAVHLRASDNDVDVPALPFVLGGDS